MVLPQSDLYTMLEQLGRPYLVADPAQRLCWQSSSCRRDWPGLCQLKTLGELLPGVEPETLRSALKEQGGPVRCSCGLSLAPLQLSASALSPELCGQEGWLLLEPLPSSSAPLQESPAVAGFNQALLSPIHGLMGLLSLLTHQLDDSYLPYLQIMNQNCYKLLRASSVIGDYSSFLSGQLKLNCCRQDLVAFLKRELDLCAPLLAPEGYRLNVQLPQEPLTCSFDQEKLAVVLYSLLSNSCQYCDGQNDISLSLSASDSRATLTISDRGYGIPAQALPHVWEPFYSRGLDEDSRPGLGLGLPLSRAIVELHGGTMALHSIQDQGCTVALTLPLSQGSGEGLPPLRAPNAPYGSRRYQKCHTFLCTVLPAEELL